VDLLDVNILVYAHRAESDRHREYRDWLGKLVEGGLPFAVSDHVLSGFIRVVTNPRVFDRPSPLETAIQAVDSLRNESNCVILIPGPRHWDIFKVLCRKADVRGNLVADAWLAALAIEGGCEMVTTDRDFARFPGLKFRHPLK
jgi:hypothetical protein